jgi:3-dehydroquinate synthase
MAELIKYGVIADEGFFSFLEDHLTDLLSLRPSPLHRAISISCRIKAAIVSADEREAGLRAILNFGHTLGHALEALTRYRLYSHGEAISIGMAYAARLSRVLGICPQEVSARLEGLLRRAGLPTTPPGLSRIRLLKAFGRDKKARGGEVRFVLLRAIGEVGLYSHIPGEALLEALKDSTG